MLFRDATLADGRHVDVRVEGERITAIGSRLSIGDDQVIDAGGKLLLPGAIDVHVHFREPGFSHKETWKTGSQSAAAGGVTTVVDQPNTEPPTVTGDAFDEKASLAADSFVDYGLNGGVVPDWDPDSLFERPLFALGEVFLADSTGDMGIEESLFRAAAERARTEDTVVTVHAEDADLFDESVRDRDDADAWSAFRTSNAEVAAVERACEIATDVGVGLHVAHTSTPGGVRAASAAGATCEVTPHHLFLSRDDLEDLGTFGRMNPPLRAEPERKELLELLVDGTIDVVATDHAPHTRAEKRASIWDAPSGVPGVETMLPLLLEEARRDRLSYERLRDVTALNPARIFGVPRKGRVTEGADADLVLVDPDATTDIQAEELHSKCGWTPFDGWSGVFPELTLVRGAIVYDREGGFGEAVGKNVRS